MSEVEPPIVEPWLQIEHGDRRAFLSPDDGAAICNVLRRMSEPAAQQLATVLDSAVTELLASPLHAGTRSVSVTVEERACLLEAADVLQHDPADRFAKLRVELGAE
jgi:hypothetical protein